MTTLPELSDIQGEQYTLQDIMDGVVDPEDLTPEELARIGQSADPLGVPTQNFVESTGEQIYTVESPYRYLQNINPQQFRALQDQLVAIGVLQPDSQFVPGKLTIDDPTITALGRVMTYANQSGQDINGALRELRGQALSGDLVLDGDGPGGAQDRGRFFELPDYASLRTKVRAEFKQSLGRNPTQAEMRMFTNDLMAGYEQNVEVQQANYEDIENGRTVTRQVVDPVARFEEAFQQKMGSQIQSIETQESTATAARMSEANVAAAAREATQ